MPSKETSSHHTYVEKVLKYYKDNDITPGDPNEGVWHQAHFPLPKHLGSQTVLLLAEHHAVQGVLQSEEFQTPCIWNWEKDYLDGWLLERFHYWRNQLNSTAGKVGGKAAAEVNKRQGSAFFDPETRMLGTIASIGKTGFNSVKTHKKNKTGLWDPNHKIQTQGGKATASQKWMCLETFRVSNAGPSTLR